MDIEGCYPIMYYNTKRIKEKLNWLSPVDYRLATTAA